MWLVIINLIKHILNKLIILIVYNYYFRQRYSNKEMLFLNNYDL